MKKRIIILSLVSISLLSFWGIYTVQNRSPRILFIGNSIFAFNKTVPGVIKEISPGADVVLHYSGGAKLDDHWRLGKALSKIQLRKWDYVIIQESSWVPYTDPDLTREFIIKFHEEIKKAGAETVLFMTAPYHADLWGKEGNEDFTINKMQIMSNKTIAFFNSVIQESDINIVVPAGLAQVNYMNFDGTYRPTNELYHPDNTHPSDKGTLLSALTVMETLGIEINKSRLEGFLDSDDNLLDVIKEVVSSKSYYSSKGSEDSP